MIADHDRRCIEVGGTDEVGDGMVIQMPGATDMRSRKSGWVADVDDDRALLAQGLGLFRGMRLNSLMRGSCS